MPLIPRCRFEPGGSPFRGAASAPAPPRGQDSGRFLAERSRTSERALRHDESGFLRDELQRCGRFLSRRDRPSAPAGLDSRRGDPHKSRQAGHRAADERRKSQDDPAGYVSTMADQPLNAAKVLNTSTPISAAQRSASSPRLLVQISTPRRSTQSQNSPGGASLMTVF